MGGHFPFEPNKKKNRQRQKGENNDAAYDDGNEFPHEFRNLIVSWDQLQ
jgi:hypothetical protein